MQLLAMVWCHASQWRDIISYGTDGDADLQGLYIRVFEFKEMSIKHSVSQNEYRV